MQPNTKCVMLTMTTPPMTTAHRKCALCKGSTCSTTFQVCQRSPWSNAYYAALEMYAASIQLLHSLMPWSVLLTSAPCSTWWVGVEYVSRQCRMCFMLRCHTMQTMATVSIGHTHKSKLNQTVTTGRQATLHKVATAYSLHCSSW